MLRWFIAAFTLLVVTLDAAAQAERPVTPGDRVRITPAPARAEGALVVRGVDSLTITAVGARTGREYTLPVASIRRIERSAGATRGGDAVGRGAVYGFAAGGLAGAALGAFAANVDGCCSTGGTAFKYGFALGAVGAGIGGVVGLVSRSERWEQIALPSAVVLFPPPQGGTVAGVALRF